MTRDVGQCGDEAGLLACTAGEKGRRRRLRDGRAMTDAQGVACGGAGAVSDVWARRSHDHRWRVRKWRETS
jgi:hypothetical protein